MNSDGKIAWGNENELRKMGFHIPITEDEAARLEGFPENKRLAMLAEQRHEEIAKVRKEKYPGQSTVHLVGANRS